MNESPPQDRLKSCHIIESLVYYEIISSSYRNVWGLFNVVPSNRVVCHDASSFSGMDD